MNIHEFNCNTLDFLINPSDYTTEIADSLHDKYIFQKIIPNIEIDIIIILSWQ